MWVVFWMTRAEVDYFHIHETKKEAKAHYKVVIDSYSTSCAGYAPIKKATEPHWYE